MKTLKILLLCTALMVGCTQSDDAIRVLESAGYTEVQLHGYAFFDCAEDDFYKTEFTAKGPNGKPVSGVVCAGMLLKGSTIRLH